MNCLNKTWVFLGSFLILAQSAFAIVEPDVVIDETAKNTFAAIDSKRDVAKSDVSIIYDVVEQVVLPHFDFGAMSQWVLGKHWRKATTEEKQKFSQAFQTMLVRTYASQLLDYRYEQISIRSTVKGDKGKKAKVRTMVNRDGADAVPITYSLRLRKDKWVVYDVEIEGISLVTNYRSAFADEASKNGVGALAEKLAQKNAEELKK